MRIDRLELETPSETVELTLHPSLTVVTGLGRLEREALTSEILGAIGSGRPGLSADVLGPDGKFLRVLRPLRGTSTVTDAISGDDLSAQYRRGDSIDLLATLGLDRGQARAMFRMGRRDVRAPEGKWELIQRLARIDQDKLWRTATDLLETEVEVSDLTHETSSQRGHIDILEDAHAAVEKAADRLEQLESNAVATATAAVMVAFLAGVLFGPWLALPCLLVAVGAGAAYWKYDRDLQSAVVKEDEVLEANGITTYLDYQMTRIESLTEGPDRGRRLELMEQKRATTSEWETLTGGVSIEWAIDHRPEITQLSQTIDTPEETQNPHLLDVLPRLDDAQLGAVDALQQRVGQLSVLFPTGMTMLLDDPLSDLDDVELTAALSTVDDALQSHQIVLMSDDPRIVRWAHRMVKDSRATVLNLGGQTEAVESVRTSPTPSPAMVGA